MIGLYMENLRTLTQLVELLQSLPVEGYQSDKTYDAVLWLSSKPVPPGVSVYSVTNDTFPCTFSEWRLLILRALAQNVCYQNNFFIFEASKRLLTDSITQTAIALTEKESAFLTFLVLQPNHQASKEEVLHHVWQYHPDTETHTVESHFYALKQKIGPHANQLLDIQNGYFCLI